MNIVTIISSLIESTRRKLKVTRLGTDDTQTPYESMPYGVDSNPIKGMKAVYSETLTKGQAVIVGYINNNQLAESGENRLYSTDDDGNLEIYIWLKKNGTMELGGNAKHMVRFEELETGFNQLKSDFNTFLTHVHGGSGTPPAPPQLPSTASIAASKINEIKTL